MKKILLASTALIGFAGAAAAEVKLSGWAEMGIVGGDGMETQFSQDVGITVKMTGETDSGLSFGASYEIQSDDGQDTINGGFEMDNEQVFISGAFGKLTMGEIDGALDWAMTEVALGTAINDEGTTHVGYNGNGLFDGGYDNQVVRYEYTFGDFAVAVSMEQDDTYRTNNDPVFGLGGKYTTELSGVKLGFGLGLQSGENVDVYGLSVKGEMENGFTGILNYSSADFDIGNDYEHVGVGVGYETGALLVAANYGKYMYDIGGDVDGFGLIANYDLGGGAVVAAGYASDTSLARGDQDQFSIGLSLSF